MASAAEVDHFLERFRKAINEGRWTFVWRDKNLECLAGLGISVQSAKDILLELTNADYIAGPEADRDGTEGEIWKFTKVELGELLYIKLKLEYGFAKVLSFHPAEYEF
jgi:hypothetical protein